MPKAPGGYPPGAFGVQGNKPLSLALLDKAGLRLPASAALRLRLADRCPNNDSLFPPLAAVVAVAPSRGASGETVYFAGTAKASPSRGGGTPQARRICYYDAAFSAASTTWLTSTEVVTVPTPPGTGVMASTTGSASPKRTSPQSLPSSLTWMPTSTTT